MPKRTRTVEEEQEILGQYNQALAVLAGARSKRAAATVALKSAKRKAKRARKAVRKLSY